MLRYYVATYTANVRNAATTADVTITLFGSRGDSGARKLSESRTRQTKFAQGQIDVFSVEAVSLGALERVIVEHNGNDRGIRAADTSGVSSSCPARALVKAYNTFLYVSYIARTVPTLKEYTYVDIIRGLNDNS